MMRTPMSFVRVAGLLAALSLAGRGQAQCPQLYDYWGNPSDTAEWYSCSGGPFTLVIASPQNIVGGFTINWGDGSPLHVGGSLIAPGTVTHVYAPAVAEYTVTFTELVSGCVVTGTVIMEESTSASIQIPVGGLTQVCAPQAVDFINSSTNVSPNTVFTWDFGDASTQLVYDHTNLGQTVTHTYMPGTVSCETTVRLYAENTCNTLQGGPSVATFNPIRVWDIDSAQIAPSATLLCWPDRTVTFLNVTDRNCLQQGNIYQRFEYWNFGDYWGQGHDSIINWAPWPPTFPRTIQYPGIGTYEVMLLDSNYCGIDTAYVQITIVPPPNVSLSATPDTVCAGGTIAFDQTTGGGANFFEWDFGTGAGFQWTGAGDQSHTYGTPGTFVVSYAASIQGATAGCADTASVTVVVLPSPTADFTVDQDAACDSLTVTFTNTSVNAVSHLWDLGDGTIIAAFEPTPHFYGTPGTYTVTLTVTNSDGCQDTHTHDIHVYAPPVVQIGAQNVCEGVAAQFSDQTVTEPGNPVVQWAWDFGDGATSTLEDPTHLYAGNGGHTVTLTVTTPYCGGTGVQNVLVEALPTAAFLPVPSIGCSPLDVQFTNTSSGAVSYAWDFGDGTTSTATAPSHIFQNAGPTDVVDTVMLIASTLFGCSDTATALITVAPPVVAGFTHNALPGCAPLDVQFTNTSTGAGSYAWDFGDGGTSTAVSPAHQYVNNTLLLQTNTVQLIATSAAGCVDTARTTLLVYPMPQFTFATQPDSGCSPLTVTFPTIVGAVSHQWDFGDGATGTGPSPTHTYLNITGAVVTYPVTMIGANAFGCVDTTYDQVTVFPMPTAAFTTDLLQGCHPLTAQLTNTSQGAVAFNWSYGDGGTSDTSAAVHGHTWSNFLTAPQTFTIGLTAANVHGCSATATGQVQVYPAVIAQFTADTVGCAPFDPDLANLSIGATSHFWTFGDGGASSQPSPAHTYLNQGLADVVFTPTLVATSSYGCSDTAQVDVLVHPAPIAQFVPSALAGCQPFPLSAQDLSIGATTIIWTWGDGTQQSGAPGNVAHTYAHADSVPVSFTITQVGTSVHGCMDTAQAVIQVYPAITAAFTAPADGCSPLAYTPVNMSTGASSYLWDMGDGVTLVGNAPTHTYVNGTPANQTWTVTLTATSAWGCTDTEQMNVVVHPSPTAQFQATPFIQQFPASTVSLINNTGPGPWTHDWSMGDGGTLSGVQPGSYTYGTWGQFTIMLVVTDNVCSDTATQVVTIEPPYPTAAFIGSGEGCAPLTVQFTNTSLLGEGYLWNFGDGGSSTADDPVYTYTLPGTYTVMLTAYGPGGTVNTAVHIDSIVVHPSATAYFVLQPEEVVVPGQPVYCYNLSGNADSYAWDFGDGTTSALLNPVHTYTDPGSYTVSLIANNAWNCPDTFVVADAVTGIASGEIAFPNAFTPNSDGPTDGLYDPNSMSNDFFFPVQEGVEDYHLQVFNRWGELVFETFDVKQGWDGFYRGQPAKQDVYAWKARARFSDGREETLKGDVTLIR